MGWMRLLHHCLTAHDDMQDLVAAAAAPTPNLLNTCTALLVSSAVSTFAPDIDTVLLKLGLHSAEMGLALVDNMLRSTSSLNVAGKALPVDCILLVVELIRTWLPISSPDCSDSQKWVRISLRS